MEAKLIIIEGIKSIDYILREYSSIKSKGYGDHLENLKALLENMLVVNPDISKTLDDAVKCVEIVGKVCCECLK